jgi:hypothetical protein
MRRMLNDALYTEGEYGGLLSELHAVARSGRTKSAVVSRTTMPLSTTVTCGTIFLEALRRSAATQFV